MYEVTICSHYHNYFSKHKTIMPSLQKEHINTSIIHTVIDTTLCMYSMYASQYCIFILFLAIIILNYWNDTNPYLERAFPWLRDYRIELFHSALQMMPLSISLAFYNENDILFNTIFTFVFLSFIFYLYSESNKLSSDADNNTRMTMIIFLCVFLDYLQVIIHIITKLIFTNNYFFYKFIFTIYPCTIMVVFCISYDELRRYGIRKTICEAKFKGFIKYIGFLSFFNTLFALFLEYTNASWIIFVYAKFLSKIRHASSKSNNSNFDNELKDSIFNWLNE
eukprot:544121_1